VDEKSICLLHGRTLKGSLMQRRNGKIDTNSIAQVIDEMGVASSKAQKLRSIITTYSKFAGTDHRIYIKIDGNKVAGILKTGEKKLFYHDTVGQVKELSPLCVLDFYVHESIQRKGFGKDLFEQMLHYEQTVPAKIAYDRPSPKLIGF
jgi:alpha-tubulin N-acetyltransferase 1